MDKNPTVKSAIIQYLQYKREQKVLGEISEKHYNHTSYLLTRWISLYLGENKYLSNFDVNHYEKYIIWRKSNTVKGIGQTSLLYEHNLLQAFLNWCYKNKLISTEMKMKKPKFPKVKRGSFNRKELTQFLKLLRAKDTTLFFYMRFVLASFCRPGTEVEGLQWKHIITNNNYVEVHFPNGKVGRRSSICRHSVKHILRVWKHIRPAKTINDYIFPKISMSYRCKTIRECLQHMGMTEDMFGQKMSAYSIRHSQITMHLNSGADPYSLAKNSGTSLNMISKYYDATTLQDRAKHLFKRP